jgi:hypothetical protein
MTPVTIFTDPKAYADPAGWHPAGPAEYTAATFVGAPKRVPIRYRLRA